MPKKIDVESLKPLIAEIIAEQEETRPVVTEVQGVSTTGDAVDLYDAMKGLGTDEEAIKKVLRNRIDTLANLYDEFNAYAGSMDSSDDLVDWLEGDGMPNAAKLIKKALKLKSKSRYAPGEDPKDVEGRKTLRKAMGELDIDKIRKGKASPEMMAALDKVTTDTWQVSGFNNKDMAGRGAYYIAELINSGFSKLKQIAAKPEKSEPDADGTVTIQGKGDFQAAVRELFDSFRLKKYASGAIYFLSWIAFGPAAAFFGKLAPGAFGAVKIAAQAAPPVGKVAKALNISKGATYQLTKRQTAAGIGAMMVAPGLASDVAIGAEKVVSEQDDPFASEKVADDYGLSMKNAPGWDAGGVVNFMQDLFGVTKAMDAFMEAFDDDALLAQKRLGNALYLIFIRNDVKTENDAYNKVIELFKGLGENIKAPSVPLVKSDGKQQTKKQAFASAEEDIFAEEEFEEDDAPDAKSGAGEVLAVFDS